MFSDTDTDVQHIQICHLHTAECHCKWNSIYCAE